MSNSDPFDALSDLDFDLEERLGCEMLNADFEQGMIRGGERIRQVVEKQGLEWSAATFVWTLIATVMETEHSDASAAAWLEALEGQGVIERSIEALS